MSEAVVVGAGPAGSLAALLLARAGWRVTLIDKSRFPRPKVCGDCINPRAWSIWRRHGLEKNFAALSHGSIREIQLESEGNVSYEKAFEGKDDFRAIDRATLDAWLCAEAQQAGAAFIEEATVRTVRNDGTVETDRGSFRAQFILGADGRNSLVAQQAGLLPPEAERCRRVGWQVSLRGMASSTVLAMNVFPDGYYGLVDIGAGQANLTMVLDARSPAKPREIVERYLPNAQIEELRSIAPISRRAARAACGPFFLLGDAARVVEPFTGEGIYFALASAEIAAETLIQGKMEKPEKLADLYRARHRRLYRGELGVNQLTRWLLTKSARMLCAASLLRHSPWLLDRLMMRVLDKGG